LKKAQRPTLIGFKGALSNENDKFDKRKRLSWPIV